MCCVMLHVHVLKAYSSPFVYLYVANSNFSKIAKDQVLVNAVQAQCDNIFSGYGFWNKFTMV